VKNASSETIMGCITDQLLSGLFVRFAEEAKEGAKTNRCADDLALSKKLTWIDGLQDDAIRISPSESLLKIPCCNQ
jgi:hypothetical protein